MSVIAYRIKVSKKHYNIITWYYIFYTWPNLVALILVLDQLSSNMSYKV